MFLHEISYFDLWVMWILAILIWLKWTWKQRLWISSSYTCLLPHLVLHGNLFWKLKLFLVAQVDAMGRPDESLAVEVLGPLQPGYDESSPNRKFSSFNLQKGQLKANVSFQPQHSATLEVSVGPMIWGKKERRKGKFLHLYLEFYSFCVMLKMIFFCRTWIIDFFCLLWGCCRYEICRWMSWSWLLFVEQYKG